MVPGGTYVHGALEQVYRIEVSGPGGERWGGRCQDEEAQADRAYTSVDAHRDEYRQTDQARFER